MLKFLKGLFGHEPGQEIASAATSPAPEESSSDDRVRFAHLILSEVRL